MLAFNLMRRTVPLILLAEFASFSGQILAEPEQIHWSSEGEVDAFEIQKILLEEQEAINKEAKRLHAAKMKLYGPKWYENSFSIQGGLTRDFFGDPSGIDGYSGPAMTELAKETTWLLDIAVNYELNENLSFQYQNKGTTYKEHTEMWGNENLSRLERDRIHGFYAVPKFPVGDESSLYMKVGLDFQRYRDDGEKEDRDSLQGLSVAFGFETDVSKSLVWGIELAMNQYNPTSMMLLEPENGFEGIGYQVNTFLRYKF